MSEIRIPVSLAGSISLHLYMSVSIHFFKIFFEKPKKWLVIGVISSKDFLKYIYFLENFFFSLVFSPSESIVFPHFLF